MALRRCRSPDDWAMKGKMVPAVLAAGIACAALAQTNTQDPTFIAYLDSHNVLRKGV